MMHLGKKSPKPLKQNSQLKDDSGWLRRKSLKKQSELAKQKEVYKQELLKEDILFYSNIWFARPHICFETGEPLGHYIELSFFHHILPKEHYPKYRHSEWNIVLLAPHIHNQVETHIEFCPKVNELTKQLLYKHKNNLL